MSLYTLNLAITPPTDTESKSEPHEIGIAKLTSTSLLAPLYDTLAYPALDAKTLAAKDLSVDKVLKRLLFFTN